MAVHCFTREHWRLKVETDAMAFAIHRAATLVQERGYWTRTKASIREV